MTIEDLTPEEREEIQLVFLRRWLALRHPKGDRRQMDHPRPAPVVKALRWPPPWKRCA